MARRPPAKPDRDRIKRVFGSTARDFELQVRIDALEREWNAYTPA
jgi:hypothetical protein